MLTLSSFLAGLAIGLWAGRKNALHPTYFSERLARLLEKAKR